VSHSFTRLGVPPALDAVATALLDGGHVWLHEYPDGTPLWLRLQPSGALEFAVPVGAGTLPGADDGSTSDDEADGNAADTQRRKRFDAADAPPEFGFAVRHAQRQFDRSALDAAVSNPEEVTFLCVAVHRRRIAYDWDAVPLLVGIDVHYPDASFLPHEIEQLFEGVGLTPAPVVDKEVHTRDLDAGGVEIPQSNWRDGSALGVLYRGKDGTVARQIAGDGGGGGDGSDAGEEAVEPVGEETVEPVEQTAREYAERVVTEQELDAAVTALTDAGLATSVDAITAELFDRAIRASFPELTHDATGFALSELRSEIAGLVAERRGRGG
jgi:hypothetical protein